MEGSPLTNRGPVHLREGNGIGEGTGAVPVVLTNIGVIRTPRERESTGRIPDKPVGARVSTVPHGGYEERMTDLAHENGRSRARLFGRLAAVLLVGSGAVSLATVPLPSPRPYARIGLIVVAAVAMVIGGLAWWAPWDRWSSRASLARVPVGLSLIAAGNYFGQDADPRAYGLFFVVVFVWLGVTQPPWTSVWVSPLAAAAYVLPVVLSGGSPAEALSSAAFAIPVCVLVGESLAWGCRYLARTESALERERLRTERLKALEEFRTTFMTMISHELRTPVTICRGHLDVLGPEPSNQEVRETVGVVVDELARMGRIIEDINTLIRAEDPGFIRPEPIPLDRFVREVAAKAAPLMDGRLRTVDPPVTAPILADPQRLTQALLNLLQNAAVHTKDDSPVDLRVQRVNGHWRFEVADRGGGIPSDLEPTVFEPFTHGDPSVTGMGLGLAIVRTIAQAHGGSAGVRNAPGVGATFWVKIPAGTGAGR
jgi:signal transduction histidine kinase